MRAQIRTRKKEWRMGDVVERKHPRFPEITHLGFSLLMELESAVMIIALIEWDDDAHG